MQRFRNKSVIVTGSNSGMGLACALSFLAEGAAVALVDIESEAMQLAVDRTSSKGTAALCILCNAANSLDVTRTVDKVKKEFGGIDILVNNAGVLRTTTPLEAIPEEEWDTVMSVNLKGVFLFSKAVLPVMRQKRYGRIVNISSSAGRSTSTLGGAHYTASKAGVLGLTRHTAREYGQYGITVNSVCPGLVKTPMVRAQASQEQLDHWTAQIPLGRLAEPQEEADLVLFLASDQAGYITGATIDFNGGSLLL